MCIICTFAYVGSIAECTLNAGREREGGREVGGREGGGGGEGAQGERPASSDVHISLTVAGSFHIPPGYPWQPAKGEKEDSYVSCKKLSLSVSLSHSHAHTHTHTGVSHNLSAAALPSASPALLSTTL